MTDDVAWGGQYISEWQQSDDGNSPGSSMCSKNRRHLVFKETISIAPHFYCPLFRSYNLSEFHKIGITFKVKVSFFFFFFFKKQESNV